MSLFKFLTSLTRRIDYGKPIPPFIPMDGWKEAQIDNGSYAFHEPLVPLGIFSGQKNGTFVPEVFSDGIYYGEHDTSPYEVGELNGALLTSFVRQGVAERLAKAVKLLPAQHAFMVLDSYRSEQTQAGLFRHFVNDLMAPPFSYSEEKAVIKTQDYVSQPSKANSPHMTGGAVDLTLVKFEEAAWKELTCLTKELKEIDRSTTISARHYEIETRRYQLLHENSETLDMGVAFDEVASDADGQPMTALRYFEEKLERTGSLSEAETQILGNRRLLYNVLTSVGFTFFPEEIWHADYGDKFWAKQIGSQKSLYGFIELSQDNLAHEDMRRLHHAQNFKNIRRSDRHMRAHKINPAGLLPA
jgi:D-alanyl-D-alanine dipeptidase